MRAERGHYHRSTIPVVSGIVDVLQAGRQIDSTPNVNRVKGLHDVLTTVVQVAIAEEKAEAPIGEIDLVIFLDCVGHEGNACPILFAMPPGASRAKSEVEGLIVFGVCKRFRLAVIPTEAAECGEVMSEILLQVYTESVFPRNMPGMIRDVGGRTGKSDAEIHAS